MKFSLQLTNHIFLEGVKLIPNYFCKYIISKKKIRKKEWDHYYQLGQFAEQGKSKHSKLFF